MVFFHQLRLLLWKNYTLKKRAPYILLIELVVPLVLFLILVSIRNHRAPYKTTTNRWYPDALPSAGLIPLLQSFCHGGSVLGKNGYQTYPNASINKLLKDIADITNTPVFNAIAELKELEKSFESFEIKSNYSDIIRVIPNVKIKDIISNSTNFKQFLLHNLSMPQDLVNTFMNSSFNGDEITDVLLEKNYDLFDNFLEKIQSNEIPNKDDMKELAENLILQSLFDPTAMIDGPAWMILLYNLGDIPALSNLSSIDLSQLGNFIKEEILDVNTTHDLVCDNEKFKKLMIFPNNTNSQKSTNELQYFLCKNLTSNQFLSFTNELMRSISWNAVNRTINFKGPTMKEMINHAEIVRNDLLKVENIESAVKLLYQFSKDLHLNISKIESRANDTRSSQNIQNVNDLWTVLSPVLCGTHRKTRSNKARSGNRDLLPQLLEGSKEATHALKIMLYMLSNDPMILYSPNGTEVDDVIKKSSHTLQLLKSSRDLAHGWLKVSHEFQNIVKNAKTQAFLKQMMKSLDRFPFLFERHPNISKEKVQNISKILRGNFPNLVSNETLITSQEAVLKNLNQYIKFYGRNINPYVNESRPHVKYAISILLSDKNGTSPFLHEMNSVDKMALGWLKVLKPMKFDIFYGFRNETVLNQFISNHTKDGRLEKPIVSAIVFDNIPKSGKLPKHVYYRIRMDGRLLFTTQQVRSRYWVPGPMTGNSKYYYFGFTWMQDQIERSIIEVLTKRNVSVPGLYVQEMPYPCYLSDNFMFIIQYIMPLCTVVSFIYSVAIIVQSIVYEKEQRLKEVMKMMGLSNAVHWTSWFITSAVTMAMIVILLTIILKTGKILTYSDTAVVFTFFTLAAIATINFCFLISIFFSKAKLAAACGGIIYFVTYMPYVFISIQEGGSNHVFINSNYKSLASLFSTTAFGLGARYFALFEQNGVGVHWDNLATSPLEKDDFNLAQVFTMLLVDIFVYAILVWYIEAIHPGEYGIPRPWYFPFQLSYWFDGNTQCSFNFCQAYMRLRTPTTNNGEPPNTPALLAMEEEPSHLKLGVFIDNLVKTYKKGTRPAVDHLSLRLYEGQITSFLGHNGAGKTTTMSLLTGLFPPSTGTAYIYGHDIHSEMDKIRTSLGMCPQHNVLYERLTVDEHLWFYARLKGMSAKEVRVEMDRILEDIGLPNKRHSYVETLSGGMKRKLSVAMAFVGGSRTVILDEPTAGVDPYARRAIWELLAKYKDGRTILLSTHFMDEADILGDRIAIISHGKLRCCGSSLFLKKKFGDGYHLTLVKETHLPETAVKQSTDFVTKFIQDHIPSAQLICETQYELSYVLPDKGKERKGMLKQLFANLERNKEKLQCQSFGLQDTTLEEVFLKVTEATVVGEDSGTPIELTTSINLNSPISPTSNTSIQIETPQSPISEDNNGSSIEMKTNITKNLNSKPIPKRKFIHKRSLSSDIIERKFANAKENQAVCAHRRTPSGGFCGHRRALSSDLSFVLQAPSNKDEVKTKRKNSLVTNTRPTVKNIWEQLDTINFVNSNLRRWMQFYALLLKRFHHSRRNVKSLLTHILLPGLFVSIAMTVALSQPKVDTYPPLVLSPTMFHPPPYYIPYSNSKQSADNISYLMEKSFRMASGVGSDCVLKNPNITFQNGFSVKTLRKNLDKYFDKFCKKQVGVIEESRKHLLPITRYKHGTYKEGTKEPTCTCDKNSWQYVCDPDAEGKQDKYEVVTLDTMVNVNKALEEYLLYTSNKYRRMRYGALTFGDSQHIVPSNVRNSRFRDVQKLYAKDSAKVWFSNKGYHSMPTFINVMDNAILRSMITPDMGNPAAYGITAVSHPFNFTKNVLNLDAIKQGTDAIIAIFVIISMSFVPASFVVFLVMERTTKTKHLQFVSGVNPVLYWLSNYVWDLVNFLIPITACLIIFHIFNVPAYASSTNFPAVCALFFAYGWSITPMMYPASFIFKEASTAYVVLIIVNLFLGITCTVTTTILQLFPSDPQLIIAFDLIKMVSLLFPNYCLGRGLMDLAYNELMNMVYSMTGQFDSIQSPFEWHIITRSLVFMISEGLFFFILTIIIEYKISVRRRNARTADNTIEGEDIDVANERERVMSGGAEDDVLRVENLTKVYNSRKTGKHLAVNQLCLGVSKGECFGLLGVNGAGKTTTFKMLSGDIEVTAGEAFIENKSVVKDVLSVHSLIGYCPQFDALIDSLTAEEHLYFYGRLKGIPEADLKDVVSNLIQAMALSFYAKKQAYTYSGGNKRKLSAAIALLGNPSIIFMDEPTTGMDPGARRFLWNVILSVINQGKSVVLTSHSMEECEALCTRLAIMVNGRFQCLGSTQHIKNRFGDGYIIVIRVKGSLPNMGPIQNFMEEQFPDSVLKESHHNLVQYQIPSSDTVCLSYIFEKMERVCEELEIEDYSVSQTSLDNVFVSFAKEQRDSTTDSQISTSSRPPFTNFKQKIQQVKETVSNIKFKRKTTGFTQLVEFPDANVCADITELTGAIGEDEDEVDLENVDMIEFPRETTRLTFNT